MVSATGNSVGLLMKTDTTTINLERLLSCSNLEITNKLNSGIINLFRRPQAPQFKSVTQCY